MAVGEFRIRNYRSIESFDLTLGQATVVVGPNASGKTNLYRAMSLLHHAAQGRLLEWLAQEGGVASILFAAARDPRITVGVTVDGIDWDIELGPDIPE